MCNLFTELGVAYIAGAVDKTALVAASGIVVDYWKKLLPFIKCVRSRSVPISVYTAWEKLYIEITKTGIHRKDYSS